MSYQYQPRDKKPRNEKIYDNSVELFVDSSHASSPGQPNVVYPTPEHIEFMEAIKAAKAAELILAKYAKYANGAMGTMTVGTGNSKRRSAQQSLVLPSNSQSTSRGGMPNQGSPSARPSRKPKSNKGKKGKSRPNTQSNSSPQQNFNGCFKPEVSNDNAFNNNNYYGSRWSEEDQEETSSEEEEDN